MKAPKSGRVLSNADAALIKSMIARGDRQHDIAAYFGVNGGRIGEISRGATFAGLAAATGALPPSPPYVVIRSKHLQDAKDVEKELQKLSASPAILAKIADIIQAMTDSKTARDGV
jgi:hypothetical protein